MTYGPKDTRFDLKRCNEWHNVYFWGICDTQEHQRWKRCGLRATICAFILFVMHVKNFS